MSSRTERLYVKDILESIEAIFSYTQGFQFFDFSRDRMRYSAVIREFEIIGEAIGKLPEALKGEYPQVPWQDIKDFRNLLAHEYFGVDLEIVWRVVCDDLPNLYKAMTAIEESLTT